MLKIIFLGDGSPPPESVVFAPVGVPAQWDYDMLKRELTSEIVLDGINLLSQFMHGDFDSFLIGAQRKELMDSLLFIANFQGKDGALQLLLDNGKTDISGLKDYHGYENIEKLRDKLQPNNQWLVPEHVQANGTIEEHEVVGAEGAGGSSDNDV